MKTSKQFIIDLTRSKQVLLDAVNAIGSGDSSKTNAFISDCGYDLSVDNLKNARGAAESGCHFNISVAAGLYNISEPEDLKDHKLKVDPSNGRIYIDGAIKRNATEPDGKVVWSDSGDTYTITFYFDYEDDGSPKPITFSGNRKNGKGGEDAVSGSQIVPGSAIVAFLNSPIPLTTAFICTVLGVSASAIIGWIMGCLEGKERTGTVEVRRALDLASEAFQSVGPQYKPPSFDYTVPSLRTDLEQIIERSVNRDLENLDPTDSRIRENASADAVAYLEERVGKTLQSSYKEHFRGFVDLLSKSRYEPLLSDIEASAVEKEIGSRRDGLRAEAPYLQSAVEYCIHSRAERLARERGVVYQDAMDKNSQEAQSDRAQATNKEKAKQDLVDQVNAETDAAKKAELEQKIKNLDTEIEKLESEAKEKEERAKEAKEQRDRELENADEAEKEAKEAKDKRDTHAEGVYGDGL
ncbi:hypothetical protein F5Y00DRAFT_272477 [Daldinia vernicosa]|uniref:uncharacterized protein n=1 Tax=Daldinia vernicosa TaxID=114800 RepID=UPI0020076D13|nr:uncharacterized protein F5Y00DRAFT_272477 [Daldinia vernicosa]KAI0852846.1 hypothetical protein F5Y00DRAFT_272477 [Daldinia vernicosa]